jgi:hypothetical protein
LLVCREAKALDAKTKTDMNSSTSGWRVLTRNIVAGSHPQNDIFFSKVSRRLAGSSCASNTSPSSVNPLQ